jgi:hypothetical protein
VILGYTADGNPLYEVAFYLNEGTTEFEYTVEEQDDGTVFYHVDGAGYLKDQQGYYVRARKVTLNDGSTAIVCAIRSAVIYDDVANSYDNDWFDDYVIVDGNTITFTEEFLELAAKAKTRFSFQFYTRDYQDYYWNSYYFNYYELETLFMLEDGANVNNGGNIVIVPGGNNGVIIGPDVIIKPLA